MKRGRHCGGFGHVARHHEPVLKPESKKEIDDWKAANPSKGKKSGGKGKGSGKKGAKGKDQRLDMNETHTDNRDRALRLLEALLVTRFDSASSSVTLFSCQGLLSWRTALILLLIPI